MTRWIGIVVSLAALASPALADVTVERFIRSGGFAGMGANETTTVEKLSGLRKREASTTKLTGALGGFLGSAASDIRNESITDVSKDTVWTLDHGAKTYSEASISASYQRSEAKSSDQKKRDEKSSDVKVVRNEVTVTETGQKKDLHGFPCTQYIITWLVETEDTQSKERSKLVMTTELWNTPETKETRALAKEEEAFNQAYWKKTGASVSAEDRKNLGLGSVGGMLGQDEKSLEAGMKDLRAKMETVKGFSISTSLRWEMNPKEGNAAKAQKTETSKKKSSEESSPRGPGSFFGGLRRAIEKDVRGRTEPEIKEEPEPRSTSTLFDSHTEIRKISLSSVPASEFQLPSGYKLSK